MKETDVNKEEICLALATWVRLYAMADGTKLIRQKRELITDSWLAEICHQTPEETARAMKILMQHGLLDRADDMITIILPWEDV